MTKGYRISTILCVLAVLSSLLLTAFPANAASSSEIRQQIEEMEAEQAQLLEQMEALEAVLQENAEQLSQMVEQKITIDQQINLLLNSIDNVNEQIAAYGVLIADTQEDLEEAQARLEQLNETYKLRLRTMEEEGNISYWSVLLEANSFMELLDRLEMVQQIAAADRVRLQELREAAAEVQNVQDTLKSEKAEQESVCAELSVIQEMLDLKQEQTEKLLCDLLSQGEEYEQLLDWSEAEEQRLLEEIANLEIAFDEAAYQEWLATSEPPTEATQSMPPISDSGWMSPVMDYRLSSPFGMRLHPILGYYRMHNGVDMACPEWTPIYAARGGQVTVATYSSSAGNYVQINHGDGYRSVYMHMVEYVVNEGDFVSQGQLIGYVGNTGLSKGAHLHFGISYNGEYVNPMECLIQ